jgi:hypothetical protein
MREGETMECSTFSKNRRPQQKVDRAEVCPETGVIDGGFGLAEGGVDQVTIRTARLDRARLRLRSPGVSCSCLAAMRPTALAPTSWGGKGGRCTALPTISNLCM